MGKDGAENEGMKRKLERKHEKEEMEEEWKNGRMTE
jgi:hypothetical protein